MVDPQVGGQLSVDAGRVRQLEGSPHGDRREDHQEAGGVGKHRSTRVTCASQTRRRLIAVEVRGALGGGRDGRTLAQRSIRSS